MTIEIKPRWAVATSTADRDNKTQLPKIVRTSLDWQRKFEKGLNILVWLDIRLDDSSALVTTLYGEDMINTVDRLKNAIRSSGFV